MCKNCMNIGSEYNINYTTITTSSILYNNSAITSDGKNFYIDKYKINFCPFCGRNLKEQNNLIFVNNN